MITNTQHHDAISLAVTIEDTFYTVWDVDGQWYVWVIYRRIDTGALIVGRYLP